VIVVAGPAGADDDPEDADGAESADEFDAPDEDPDDDEVPAEPESLELSDVELPEFADDEPREPPDAEDPGLDAAEPLDEQAATVAARVSAAVMASARVRRCM